MDSFNMRAAQSADLENIAGLLNAVFAYDGIPIVQTVVELEEEFVAPSCTIENDVKVVELEGKLVGVKSVGSGQLGFYDRAIVPLAYRMIGLFGGKIPGINLIAILKNPQ